MKTAVVLGLAGLNPAQTVQLGQNIFTEMTGNEHFTKPSPELTVLQTNLTAATGKINAYSTLVDACGVALTARDNALDDLRATINALGAYVENVSGGDEEIILSAGMGVRATPVPASMTQVQKLILTASQKAGELLAQWNFVPGARVYRVHTSTTPDVETSWVEKLRTTKAKCSLNHDLVSGTKVSVRVCAVGAHDEGAWSEVATKVVP